MLSPVARRFAELFCLAIRRCLGNSYSAAARLLKRLWSQAQSLRSSTAKASSSTLTRQVVMPNAACSSRPVPFRLTAKHVAGIFSPTYPRIPKNHIDQVNVGFGRTTLTILTNLWIFVVGVDIERTTRTKLTKYGFLWLVWFSKEAYRLITVCVVCHYR